ncbi:MAG: hypothetical protein AVDCRST_MAG37-3225 [uncultured Rubrobacteraceae bacterium]|uniref:Uncharacterized protein n=1 Tax=uncultured Rubrobacteraceae bacterium TaxID=349277 RepID=A0A6J4R6V2_9ACTN|nr:MAG: hypothetical protein AVDCRST_MAG37-3225 [uncultured Rubrobacteraceae bacterium]
MTYENERQGREEMDPAGDESGIIVFGGGSGCSGRGCLFWIIVSVVLSVTLTLLLNLVVYLF